MMNDEARERSARRRDSRHSCSIRHSFVIPDIRIFVIAIMSVTYLEAIREAQAHLLREDERVFIYGQDVSGKFGGAFKATKGLAAEFPGRVLNTPISEDAMVGTAIGAAMGGMRPIVEMQFADFSSIALNQILNNAGTQYWRTNIPCPITVRLPSGGTKGQRPVPQPEHGSDLFALPGAGRGRARHGGGRLHDVDRRGRDRRPGHLLRAQVSLLPSQSRRPAEGPAADRESANRQAGARSEHRHLQRDGARSARGREAVQRRRRSRSKWSICAA